MKLKEIMLARQRISEILDDQKLNEDEKFLLLKQEFWIMSEEFKMLIVVPCYAWALRLCESKIFFKMRSSNFPSADSLFIKYLLIKEYLKPIENPITDCIVLYTDNRYWPKHAGLLIQNDPEKIVESRFGDYNKIIKHKLWYVPLGYGESEHFFHPVVFQDSEKFYIEYCDIIQRILKDTPELFEYFKSLPGSSQHEKLQKELWAKILESYNF